MERLTQGGLKAALIERHLIGGTCVNTGCMPTKALVASARAARVVRGAGAWGVDVLGEIAIDMKTIKARADAVTANARNGLEAWLGGLEGCTLVRGLACFVSADTVAVGERRLSADISSSTTSWRPARRASGRWVIAMVAAPLPIPPTMTSRSSPPTCWTARRAG